ncbi:asparagine synthase (glutamine-hydrolyzing) [Rhodococcus sp. BP-252]|uniref:asparagine synthase (glutamine-hydrolyzing) n=1 Tax=unclassified Rhodococcus (in: high G+C Gram-positive bacteria) TaxID=192944 RepID=UPI001C9A2F7F|nr:MULTISPECIES: asparagine synthase (glutamine-hydrolyzing) [unclassified Rhodococcus (in: high G+C Gram-positive bacteria)]MBY6412749.1 asparagine synthase (glutamine-hydrolyzing) [Rhodococcus sp. BP-320]MBY6417453.1 asparagine synthase (glutamine-hydrolyzing) [Rhodococcus sp. BP-321]MBY6421769.1 asparagine synthase (glutamine-hydrolyzing) [Rhodococcus sp. BP-324]MBY6427508.1 asparagine synthase (glutamine-hydrolyzing) [Rhodococcus sp. BP-323]MBY6432641.1 asparagine synthase (glutamine-hydro
MCGITGWVSYGRDLRNETGTLRAMTDTMSRRGPDDEGLWTAEHAALGHRRLAIIDIPGGHQPMTLTRPDGSEAVIVYSGETYNFRELRRSLPDTFTTNSDTEVVLHAHEEWGQGAVEHLNGMFAYALWDSRTQELLLVRDRLGVKPLYYLETEDGVLFGSEPKAILANPLASKNVGVDGLRRLLGFVADPSNAVFDGMKEVPPGHVVRVSAHGLREVRYWGLDDHEHTDDLDTTIATVRELLDDTASRQLIADVPLCTLLSGGLDSSALTALAAQQLAAADKGAVRSFAVDFVGYADNFVADGLRDAPDTQFVRDVADHVAADHRDIVLGNDDLLDPAHRAAVLAARDYPGLGDMDTSLYLLFRAVREQSTVALSGESADEVFGGYADFHDPKVVAADTFPWLAGGMAQGRDTMAAFAPDVRAQLDMDSYYEAQYRRALAEVPTRTGDVGLEARMRQISYLYLTRFLPLLLERKDRMSMAVGLEVRVPFCDHRLVQYVFGTPWSFKTFDGREKSLLRAATADLLPQSVVQRVKSPYPSTQDPHYAKTILQELGAVLDDSNAPVSALLDRTEVEKLLGAQDDVHARHAAERVVGINSWLADHTISL